ncbi:hypothetical protein MASR1M60_05300 [Rhodocyclaceae bacterium]
MADQQSVTVEFILIPSSNTDLHPVIAKLSGMPIVTEVTDQTTDVIKSTESDAASKEYKQQRTPILTGDITSSTDNKQPSDRPIRDKTFNDDDQGLDDLAKESHPLIIQDTLTKYDNQEKLASLKIETYPEGFYPEIPIDIEHDENGCLEITYYSNIKKLSVIYGQTLPATEAAVIARVFLLAKVTSYRRRVQEILKEFHETIHQKQESKNTLHEQSLVTNINDYLSELAIQFRQFVQPNKFVDSLIFATLMWPIIGLFILRPHPYTNSTSWSIDSTLTVSIACGALAIVYLVELLRRDNGAQSSLSWFKEFIFRLGVTGSAFLPGALLVWLLWPKIMYASRGQTSTVFDCVVITLIVLASLTFLLLAGNFESSAQKSKIRAYDQAKSKFDILLSDIAQTNTNVTALYFNREIAKGSLAPESLLRKVDAILQIKEAVISLESVIRARQRYVHNTISDILENQQRVRRSVMAAGSGMLAGYFTFDVGSSVMKYLDLPAGYDEQSYEFWMLVKARPAITAIDADDTPGEKIDCTLHSLPYPSATQSEQFSVITVKVPTTKCDTLQKIANFRQKYHEDQLMDTSLLLVITFIVSLIAAWVAGRKPEKEQLN